MDNFKVMGVIWNDRITLNMFLDFVKKIYLPGKKIDILSYTLLNSVDNPDEPDIVEQTLSQMVNIPEGRVVFVTIKSPSVLNPENRVLVKTLNILPLVVYIPTANPQEATLLKGEMQFQPLLDRWAANLERMAFRK